MVKKKRKQKTTVFVSLEGKREKVFLNFLEQLYNPSQNNIHINFSDVTGGHSNSILARAIKSSSNYDRVYAIFDEVKPLSEDIRDSLAKIWYTDFQQIVKDKDLQQKYNVAKRNPIIIVSNPCSIDGFLITLFNKNLPKEINEKNCKNSFSGIVGSKFNEETELNFYKKNLTKDFLENQKDNSILQLILSIFKK